MTDSTERCKLENRLDEKTATPAHKPFMTPTQLVAALKARGVTFERCSEGEAADYLAHANNYLRAASYRKLYPVQIEGTRAGEYVGLDFEALRRLSSADRVLRSALREICIDVEHFARVCLLNRAIVEGEDGYQIVEDYLADLTPRDRARVTGGLGWRARDGESRDEYSGALIAHYRVEGYPLWVFLEVVEFGHFCDLWLFCARRWGDRDMRRLHYVLKSVKAIRNAVCHNSCIINGFSVTSERADFPTSNPIAASMNEHGLKSSKSRRSKMRNLRVAQIAAVLFASSEFCRRESTRTRHSEAMGTVREAFDAVRPLCPADGSLTSYFDFIMKLVDIWTPKRAQFE